jgi:hypothetical protein
LGAIDETYFDEARTALGWLVFSLRPVTVAELAEACSISLDDAKEPFLGEGGHDAIVQLFGVISSLVLVDEPSNKIYYKSNRWQKRLPEKHTTTCYTQRVRPVHF